jgi:hypothetical protein
VEARELVEEVHELRSEVGRLGEAVAQQDAVLADRDSTLAMLQSALWVSPAVRYTQIKPVTQLHLMVTEQCARGITNAGSELLRLHWYRLQIIYAQDHGRVRLLGHRDGHSVSAASFL